MYFRNVNSFYQRPVDYELTDTYDGGDPEEEFDFKPLILGHEITVYKNDDGNTVVEREDFKIENNEITTNETLEIQEPEDIKIENNGTLEIPGRGESVEDFINVFEEPVFINVFEKHPESTSIVTKINDFKEKINKKNVKGVSN